MIYIQVKSDYCLETIDEAATYREAYDMLADYRVSDPMGDYYLSSRACKAWRDAPRSDTTTSTQE